MNEDKALILVYQEAYNFLKSKVPQEVLDKQLGYYHNYRKPRTINGILKRMINSLKNKQGYGNFIADVDEMNTILFDFEPKKIVDNYERWKDLFIRFKEKFGTRYKMNIRNKRNAWVMYSRGILSCANFLLNFKSPEDFYGFVKSFFHNEFTIAALPMLLEKEIFGFGFPLACDFLKELGYVQYAKPDVHLKDVLFQLGLVNSKSDYKVFKKIRRIGILVKKDPVIIDKVFWLIGSGDFYESDKDIGSQKLEFIKLVSKKLK